MSLSLRLGVPEDAVARVPMLQASKLAEPDLLLKTAFEMGAQDPAAAQLLLASAMLAQADRTTEGRLAASLSMLARLVARADPAMTLGPKGSGIRAHVMPNGWRYTLNSWPRLRYAWREKPGLRDLLEVPEGTAMEAFGALHPESRDAVFGALDEVTRLTPAEPEPVTVAIQEVFPQPGISFAVSVLALGVTGWSLHRELSKDRARSRR